MSRLCTICVRRGSKGVTNKNIRNLCGKPLLAHSILHAAASQLFDVVAVSSDDARILDIARTWGVSQRVLRPPELASDNAPKLPAIRHCVLEVERRTGEHFDTIVDLDATSPLRDEMDVVAAVQLLEKSNADNVLTGTPARHSPYFNLVEIESDQRLRLVKPLPSAVVRRQDAPPTYDLNASIYVWNRDTLIHSDALFHDHTLLYVMPADRSVDIDSELDFAIVEFLMKQKEAHS